MANMFESQPSKYSGLSGIYTGLINDTDQIDPLIRNEVVRRGLMEESDLAEVWAVAFLEPTTFRLFTTDGLSCDLVI